MEVSKSFQTCLSRKPVLFAVLFWDSQADMGVA
jgi:hypothetical protein